MRLKLFTAAATAAEEELRSLHAWLLADSQVRRHADVRWDAASQMPDGGMGTLLDVLSLVIGSGLSAASLAVSVTQWRSTRGGSAPAVIVERPDGARVTISDLSADETERLLHTVFSEQPEERGEL
ncbi:effector-associated constant component EACC1 [Streptomyces canus]